MFTGISLFCYTSAIRTKRAYHLSESTSAEQVVTSPGKRTSALSLRGAALRRRKEDTEDTFGEADLAGFDLAYQSRRTHQWSPSHDTRSSGQEIPSDNVLGASTRQMGIFWNMNVYAPRAHYSSRYSDFRVRISAEGLSVLQTSRPRRRHLEAC